MLLPYWDHSGVVHHDESYPSSFHDWVLGEDILPDHQSLHTGVKVLLNSSMVRTTCKAQDMNITLDADLEDGRSVIVRQRHKWDSEPEHEHWSLTKFQNEIELLHWLHRSTSIPVPFILSVGPDFTVQEKMPGFTVATQWHSWSMFEKDRFMDSYVCVVLELFRLSVPQRIGSAMFEEQNETGVIQVGPQVGVNPSQSSSNVFDDIFKYFDFLITLKRRKLESQEAGDQQRAKETLSFIEAKIPQLLQDISDPPFLRCVLTHADLHNYNILANRDGDLTAVLDWEIDFIEPAILSAEYPAWVVDHGTMDPRFNKTWWEEGPAERQRVCAQFEKMVRERDIEFYKCLVEGRKLRGILSWLKDSTKDLGFDRFRAWAMSELTG